jgi:hypothetical protein
MRARATALATLVLLVRFSGLAGCGAPQRDPGTVVFLIQNSPASLDPRVGTDEPSEHIDE